MMADQAIKVLVAGDYVLDHHIYEGQRHEFGDRRHRGVQEVKELGGAALIHYLLQALGRGITSSLGVAIENRMPCLPPGRKVHSGSSAYAIWKAFDRERVRLRIEYNLEVLAEAEHEGWMNWHLDQGWQWGPERDFEKNTHPCLKPYIRLAPEERNKDWDSIRHYQEYAAVAGFKIKMKTQIQEKGRNGDDTSEDVLVGG